MDSSFFSVTPNDSPQAAERYQALRLWSGIVGIGIGLGLALLLLLFPLAWLPLAPTLLGAAQLALLIFALHALLTLPVEIYAGYIVERQGQLYNATWGTWWAQHLRGLLWQALLFVAAASVLATVLLLFPQEWALIVAALLFPLAFVLQRYRQGIFPPGLIEVDPLPLARQQAVQTRLQAMRLAVPALCVYRSDGAREVQGGWVGEALWLSAAALELDDDALACAVARECLAKSRGELRDSALLSAAWLAVGVLIASLFVPIADPRLLVLRFSGAMTLWSFAALFVLPAWSRRMVLRVDRAYLELALDKPAAAAQLKRTLQHITERNKFHRQLGRARQQVFHPIPSLERRLAAIDHAVDSASDSAVDTASNSAVDSGMASQEVTPLAKQGESL